METKKIVENFDLEEVKSKPKLSKILSVRITWEDFEWIKTHKISATKFFNHFLHEVMKKESKQSKPKK